MSYLVQVLIQLLLLTCDPSMAAAASMQQCLAVFFRAYAAQSGQAHRHLSAAALPAARRALSLGTSLAKSAAPQLLKFVSTLLQVGSKASGMKTWYYKMPCGFLRAHLEESGIHSSRCAAESMVLIRIGRSVYDLWCRLKWLWQTQREDVLQLLWRRRPSGRHWPALLALPQRPSKQSC